MKILVTGRGGKSGSWAIRGEQIGLAAGLKIVPHLDRIPGAFDLAVLVKRPRDGAVESLRKAKIPFVWDIVDAHPQPHGNLWDRDHCMRWLREQIAIIRPQAIVAATKAQAFDCSEFGVPVTCIPHHARPWQARNPIRETVKLIGYEGGENYLTKWHPVIQAECNKRGWKFIMNPAALVDVDIVIALRDQMGYAPRKWKSNVKLANAQGTGTPVICNREAGYLETGSGAEQWVDDQKELSTAFDLLTPYEVRKRASIHLFKATPTLEKVAGEYKAWLSQLKF